MHMCLETKTPKCVFVLRVSSWVIVAGLPTSSMQSHTVVLPLNEVFLSKLPLVLCDLSVVSGRPQVTMLQQCNFKSVVSETLGTHHQIVSVNRT